jgi:transposase
VAQVALRYTVNANLIFKWLRDPKYRPKPGAGSEEADLRFLPVEIVKEVPSIRPLPAAAYHIEIDLAGGHRMRICGRNDPEALARLIRGLSA